MQVNSICASTDNDCALPRHSTEQTCTKPQIQLSVDTHTAQMTSQSLSTLPLGMIQTTNQEVTSLETDNSLQKSSTHTLQVNAGSANMGQDTNHTNTVLDSTQLNYQAYIVQQPVTTLACGISYIGPQPIVPIEPCLAVQLRLVSAPQAIDKRHHIFLSSGSLIAHAYLTSVDGTTDLSSFVRSTQSLITKKRRQSVPTQQSKKSVASRIPLPAICTPTSFTGHLDSSSTQANSKSTCFDGHVDLLDLTFANPDSRTEASSAWSPAPYNSSLSSQYSGTSSTSPMSNLNKWVDKSYADSKESMARSRSSTYDTSEEHSAKTWKDVTLSFLSFNYAQKPMRSLYGRHVAEASMVMGLDDVLGVFFFFPDLGVRIPGTFRIKVVISDISSCTSRVDPKQACKSGTVLAEVLSDPFVSHTSATWGGHYNISKHFTKQGVHIPFFKQRKSLEG
ncbi:hypothetical protein BDV3_001820 [Batrachochytrium dendrobatidis]